MSELVIQPKELKSPFDLSARGAILVDGATGYLGSHLVAALAASGAEVRCLVHKGAKDDDIKVLRELGAKVFVGELFGNDSKVAEAFKGARLAVHLIGSIAPQRGLTQEFLHVLMTGSFIEKAKAGGVENVVMVTALGASPDAPSAYHTSKWQAEQEVLQSGLSNIILRPSLLIGRQVGRRNSKLVDRLIKLISEKKSVPLVNGGVNKLQPLFIGDMAMAAVASIDRLTNEKREIPSAPLELGGTQVLPMNELVKQLMTVLGVEKPIVSLPYPLAMVAASVCQTFQKVPLISRDQVKLSMSDNICTDNRIEELLGDKPVPLSTALQVYASK